MRLVTRQQFEVVLLAPFQAVPLDEELVLFCKTLLSGGAVFRDRVLLISKDNAFLFIAETFKRHKAKRILSFTPGFSLVK